MDEMFWLNVVVRWVHVASAVVALGATLAMRFVVLPALSGLPNAGEVMGALRGRVKRLVHAALGLLLISGFYNYIVVAIPAVRAEREAGVQGFQLYHPVMGVKILLSLVLVAVAIVLLSPREMEAGSRKKMLTVNSVIGLAILLLAAYLRRLWAV